MSGPLARRHRHCSLTGRAQEVLEMTHRKFNIVPIAVLAGALVFGAAACKKTETTTVATSPDAGAVTTTTTTTTTTTAAGTAFVPPADSVITADPVVVSQRNATR